MICFTGNRVDKAEVCTSNHRVQRIRNESESEEYNIVEP
jgi:hypothetical protein